MLGRTPELQPALLGAIFAKRGYGSWAETSARGGRIAEIDDRAARYGLPPLKWPAAWPANGLPAALRDLGKAAGSTGGVRESRVSQGVRGGRRYL